MKELFDGINYFDNPKPVELIKDILKIATGKDSLVLDFFAGSGTTAQAVMEQNELDGGSRNFILVQLPEPIPTDSSARDAGYRSIADLTSERIRRAGSKAKGRLTAGQLDVGFRLYRLADTNFTKWRMASDIEPERLEQHLLELRDSAEDDAAPDDLLAELLLKQGYALSEASAIVEVAGLPLQSVGGGLLLAYLDEQTKPTLDQLREVVDQGPTRLVILEDAFQSDDELKTNLAQLCKSKGVELWTA